MTDHVTDCTDIFNAILVQTIHIVLQCMSYFPYWYLIIDKEKASDNTKKCNDVV